MIINNEAPYQSAECFCEATHNGEPCSAGNIAWINGVKRGVSLAKSIGCPIMVVVYHKNYPSCQSLFRKLSRSQDIVNIIADKKLIPVKEELKWMPGEATRAPKVLGGNCPLYVPRIVFLNEKGEFLSQFCNRRINRKFKYFYEDVESLLRTIFSLLQYAKKCKADRRKLHNPPKLVALMTASFERTVLACVVQLLYQEILDAIISRR